MLICAMVFRVPPLGFQVNGMDMYRNKVALVDGGDGDKAEMNGDAEAQMNKKAAQDFRDPGVNMILSSAIFSKEYRIMYIMFFGNSIAGLVFLPRLANITKDIFNKDEATSTTIVAINGGFNLGGRLFFSTMSDRLGRKNSFFVMLLAQVIILAALPTIMERQIYWAFLLVIWSLTACYGGGFGCIPAFLCDMFGPSNIGALHGIILTAWSLAGVGGGLLFTGIYNHLLESGHTIRDAFVYSANLHCILVVAIIGFLFLLFVGTSIHDRLLPRKEGEFARLRVFGRLVRIGAFGVQWLNREQEEVEWANYVEKRRQADLLALRGSQVYDGSA
ncbi:hypothetical protein BGX29_011688 [Mortierella sp. GBA35]|nr:hypothetical protein BGX29_011688 [Mortierella sp. GBA35]